MTVADYYDSYWTADGFNPTGGLPADLEQKYKSVIGPSERVLDLGCGDGLTSGPWITHNAGFYLGVDISATAIEAARGNGFPAEQVDDAASLPFDDGSFGAVLAVEVFEHLFDPLAAAREAHRVLRDGGKLIVTVPNITHWKQRFDLAVRGRWDPKGDDLSIAEPWRDPHIRFFTPISIDRMLRSVGFISVHVAPRSTSIAANIRPLTRYAREPVYRGGTYRSRFKRYRERRFPSLAAGLLVTATKWETP